MAISDGAAILGKLHTLFHTGKIGDLTDGQLLERFSNGCGEDAELAFAALVDRHGPLVLRVRCGLLADPHDAQDAFQATFLILVKKARTLWVRVSLAPWLYRVAYRTASCARSEAIRRRRHERCAAQRGGEAPVVLVAGHDHELEQLLHEEINRLPERYRQPVVLCDLEGYTHEQAARCLGWPVGTVKSRQARGREQLRGRLTRRGLAPSVALMGSMVPTERISAVVSQALVDSTVTAVVRFARGGGMTGIVSATVVDLKKGVLRTMFLSRLRIILVAATLLGALSVGLGLMNHTGAANGPFQTREGSQLPKQAGKPIRQVLREAAQAVQSSPDPASRSYTLAEIVKAQARAGDKEGALESARQAAAAALALDPYAQSHALVAVAWARASTGDREGALNVLQLAKQSASAMETDWRRIEAWRSVATSQFDLGDRDAAMATIQKMSDMALAIVPSGNNRVGPLRDLVFAQTYVGDYDRAFQTVAVAGGGDHHLQGQLFGSLASGAAADRSDYLAPHKRLSVEDRKVRLQVLERIAKAVEPFEFAEQKPYFYLPISMASLGDLEGALRIARLYGKGPIKYPHTIDLTAAPLVLASIGAYQGKAGYPDKARETFREALDLVRRDPKLSMRLGQIASYQAGAGDFVGAMKTVESAKPEERAQILAEIGEEQSKSGDHDGARATFHRALEEAERHVRTPPRGDLGQAKEGKVVNADSKDQPGNISPIDMRRMDDYRAQIAAIQAKSGALKAAVEALDLITSENYKGYAASDIAEARAMAGDAEGALVWLCHSSHSQCVHGPCGVWPRAPLSGDDSRFGGPRRARPTPRFVLKWTTQGGDSDRGGCSSWGRGCCRRRGKSHVLPPTSSGPPFIHCFGSNAPCSSARFGPIE